MPDYYAILWRALRKGEFESPQWRHSVFDRTRQMLLDQLRAQQPPLSNAEIRLNTTALEAAIKTIESEFTPSGGQDDVRDRPSPASPADFAGGSLAATEAPRERVQQKWNPVLRPDTRQNKHLAASVRFNGVAWAVIAVVIAAVAAGAYAFHATQQTSAATPPPAAKIDIASNKAVPASNHSPVTASPRDGDLAPGVDGGSSEADVPFFFRRQPVFYRTTHPPGTIIIDKQQRFLYLIQPNQVALRYGIGVGKPCSDIAGLRRVTSKVEWPPWQPAPEAGEHKPASPVVLPGGPGNPLGARLLGLDDGSSRIHGTNAPKTIGSALSSGCIRMVNDDVVDLYNRVPMDARVILSD
jgi:lipoprotein-anchoring transpeptidase ErfK/SrfK